MVRVLLFFYDCQYGAACQVVAILQAGRPLPFQMKAANLDLPELQGEPEEIAKEKCRLAADQAGLQSIHTL